MARPRRTLNLVPVTVKLDVGTHALAVQAGGVAGQSTHSTLVQAVQLGLRELRHAQATSGRRTSAALLAIAPGTLQLRVTTTDPSLAEALAEALAYFDNPNRESNTQMLEQKNEPSVKEALESYRAFALEHGYEGEALQVPLNYGHAVIQFVDAPSAPVQAVQEGA